MRFLLLLLAMAVCACPAMAGPPLEGIYNSDDIPGGTLSTGRFSESWIDPGSAGQIGNTINAASFGGPGLGAEWKMQCGSISQYPQLVSDTRDGNGTGEVTWRTMYSGATFWLASSGPWGNGQDYTGTLSSLIATSTHQYINGSLVGIRSNITTNGSFDGFDESCMEYSINNATFFGDTDNNGPLPADYPPFMDSSCQFGTRTRGGWGSVTQLTILVTGCTVPVEDMTWSQVKTLFQN
jgi:hypothetical protein